jgi:hypothetical protein
MMVDFQYIFRSILVAIIIITIIVVAYLIYAYSIRKDDWRIKAVLNVNENIYDNTYKYDTRSVTVSGDTVTAVLMRYRVSNEGSDIPLGTFAKKYKLMYDFTPSADRTAICI